MAKGPLELRLTKFVADWRRDLVAYCRGMLAAAPGNLAAYVDEVVDETIARLWSECEAGGKIADGTGEDWRRWTWRVARNGCVDLLRRSARSRLMPDVVATPAVSSAFEDDDFLVLKACFDRLEPDDQDLFVSTYFCGCSSTDLSERLAVKPITIRQRLRRARMFMLQCMGELGER